MLSKLSYFKCKEESNVYKHHSVRSYDIEKENLSV